MTVSTSAKQREKASVFATETYPIAIISRFPPNDRDSLEKHATLRLLLLRRLKQGKSDVLKRHASRATRHLTKIDDENQKDQVKSLGKTICTTACSRKCLMRLRMRCA